MRFPTYSVPLPYVPSHLLCYSLYCSYSVLLLTVYMDARVSPVLSVGQYYCRVITP